MAERVSDISANLVSQLKKKVKSFVIFSVALHESTDVSEVAQQAKFIRGVDDSLSVTEEFLGLVPMIDTITANDIFSSRWSTEQDGNILVPCCRYCYR